MYNKYFQKLNSASILVFGDLILDKYLLGKSSRISLEAPVPIVEVESEKSVLGGSGNVISNLNGLGVNFFPFGLIGDDINGKQIIDLLKRFNSKNEGIFYKNETTVKTRLIANNQQIARIDWESQIIKGGGISKYENSIEKALKQSNAVIISDYNKGFCTPALTQFIIELCNAKSLPVFVDPKGDDFNKYKGANFIKPNQYEAQAVTPFKLETDNDYINSAELIREKFKIQTCIITMGERGMIYSSDDITEKIDTVAKKVYDVSGAGDTVIATLASFASIGVNALLATKIANIAAGTVISYRGTYPINIELLSKAIKENNL